MADRPFIRQCRHCGTTSEQDSCVRGRDHAMRRVYDVQPDETPHGYEPSRTQNFQHGATTHLER